MTGNTEGSYITTTEAMMQAYDKLPASVRQVLQNAPDNWVPQPLLTDYKRKCTRLFPSVAAKLVARRAERWSEIGVKEHWYRMNRYFDKGVDYFTPIRMKRK